MLNAVSVHHPVLSLARHCLLPALACCCHPPSSVRHSCRKPPLSVAATVIITNPMSLLSLVSTLIGAGRCRPLVSKLYCLLLSSLVQFLVYCHHYFLLAADILTIYHPPLLCLLSPPPMLVNSSVLSPPLSLLSAIVVLFCLKRSSPLLVSLKHSLRLVESAIACPLSY